MLETFEQICLCIDYVMLINMLFYLWKDVLSYYCNIEKDSRSADQLKQNDIDVLMSVKR